MRFTRPVYLERFKAREKNGLIKIITGARTQENLISLQEAFLLLH